MKTSSLFMLLLMAGIPSIAKADFIAADDPRLSYYGCARLSFIESPVKEGAKAARMDRLIKVPEKGYEGDNPGAVLGFKTDAKELTVHLYFNPIHISKSARNSKGIYLIDGKSSGDWTYSTAEKKTVREAEKLDLQIKVPGDGKEHSYEIIMPYADSVDICGITANDGARFEKTTKAAKRLMMFGDSVTHGFTASSIDGTYAYRTARLKNMELLNMAIAGRSSNPQDATVLASLKCEILTVLIGVNDWQGGNPVDKYKTNMKTFIQNYRKGAPDTPLYLISPLWVPESWKPSKAQFPLEDYRKALKEAVDESGDKNINFIDGTALIDHDPKYFDKVAVHPNDEGFKMMAERLAAQIK